MSVALEALPQALSAVAWPHARVAEALEALGVESGLSRAGKSVEPPAPPARLADDPDGLTRWIESTAAWLDLEAEPVDAPYDEIEAVVRGAAPALLRLDGGRFIAVLEGGRRRVTVLTPERSTRRVPTRDLAIALARPLEQTVHEEIEQLLTRTVPEGRRQRARAALLADRLRSHRLTGSWILRSASGSRLVTEARRAGAGRDLALMIAATALEYLLMLASWGAVARGALQGRFDSGWLALWIVLLVTIVPIRVFGGWCGSRLTIALGRILKTRLLVGALRLDPNEIRHQGAGQLLGRVIELGAVETLALSGGLLSAMALVEIVLSSAVLAKGAGGTVHVVLFVAFFAFLVASGARYHQKRRRWTEVRLAMTHDLVERMVGHRTRIAQELRSRWHEGEDQGLERYLDASKRLDTATIPFAIAPRAWLLVAIAALGPSLVGGSPETLSLAVALGGILLGTSALQRLAGGLTQVAAAAIAAGQAEPLLRAATLAEAPPSPAMVGLRAEGKVASGELVIDAKDLRFRHRDRGEPVLRGCSLRVRVGDRLLLEGPSGGGKSTLGSILTGIRQPQSGLLLLGGLDRQVLGAAGWRRRIVAAPQFHENHVFTGTFAFNLLMGRRWPPSERDLAEAETVCRELGLGELLDRMPGGLLQMVGETGWQLSHGERSRLFIARALLQDADVMVLDESFAALDPRTLRRALECVLARARTMLVIAHP